MLNYYYYSITVLQYYSIFPSKKLTSKKNDCRLEEHMCDNIFGLKWSVERTIQFQKQTLWVKEKTKP